MPAISKLSSDFISPSLGSEFVPEIDSSSGASWTSQFNETSMMAASTETGAVPAAGAAVLPVNNTPSNNAPNNDISAGQRMISASAGNILTGLLVTPLDVVRVRLQSQSRSQVTNLSHYKSHTIESLKNIPPNVGITACCREVFWVGDNAQSCMLGSQPTVGTKTRLDCFVEETQRRTFTSTFDGLRKIARNEGVLTLWRGLSATLMMGIPANIIYFAGYDWLRLDEDSPVRKHIPDTYAPFISGAIARTTAAAATSPIEMFRTRLQATPGTGAGHFKATLQGLHQMTKTKGYVSLWRGLTLTMWRDVPFSGLYWWGYEKTKLMLETTRQKNPQLQAVDNEAPGATAFFDSFTAGAVSGSVAALVTTPFDVGKTRQQVYRHMDEQVSTAAQRSTLVPKTIPPEELSLPKFLLHIFREEGMAGLFRGWSARVLKVAPACAIMISTYELGKRMAKDVNERRNEN